MAQTQFNETIHLAETLIGSEIVKLGGEIREKIRKGEKIYNFTVGDFDPAIFPIPKELEDSIVDAYRQHFTNYPAAEGNLDLRESIAVFLKDREELTYGTDEILVSSGGRPLIYSLFRTLIDEGDKVIYAVPSWNNNHYTHLNGGVHVVIEATAENNFMPTADALRPHVKDATLICLCSPQNPTGTTISKKDLSAICELVLEENTRRGEGEKKLYVLYDQMYWQLTYGKIQHYNPVSLYPAMREYTVFVDAISKAFAATGVRVGWSFGPAAIIGKIESDHDPYRVLGADGRAESDCCLPVGKRKDRCLPEGLPGGGIGQAATDPRRIYRAEKRWFPGRCAGARGCYLSHYKDRSHRKKDKRGSRAERAGRCNVLSIE